jgi:aldehyde:ferredoxin oxidoreductase
MDYNFTEPLDGIPGIGVMVPGPGDTVVDMSGNQLDRAKYLEMLKEFYRARGWDETTGIPKKETIKKLGL